VAGFDSWGGKRGIVREGQKMEMKGIEEWVNEEINR
jgi:hypothetical protein